MSLKIPSAKSPDVKKKSAEQQKNEDQAVISDASVGDLKSVQIIRYDSAWAIPLIDVIDIVWGRGLLMWAPLYDSRTYI